MKLRIMCLLAAAACGGGKPPVNEPAPGEKHETTPPATPLPDGGVGQPAPPVSVTPTAPTVEGPVIELKNEGPTPLSFLVTKGWGVAVFAYTGKPPKAKPVTLFESACSASCDSPEDAVCPVCPEPKDKKEEQAMARTETAAPGESLKVP